MKKYWPTFRDYGLIAIGTLVQAVALRIFFVPANLASGGVSGIAQLINHFTGWPIGMMVFVGNIPLFLLGARFLGGRGFMLRTAFAIAVYSLLADALLWLPFFPCEGITDDIVLNSLYVRQRAGGRYHHGRRRDGAHGADHYLPA